MRFDLEWNNDNKESIFPKYLLSNNYGKYTIEFTVNQIFIDIRKLNQIVVDFQLQQISYLISLIRQIQDLIKIEKSMQCLMKKKNELTNIYQKEVGHWPSNENKTTSYSG